MKDTQHDEEQAATHRRIAEKSFRLAGVEANTRALTSALEKAEQQKSAMGVELSEVQQRVASLRAMADADASTRKMLEKELQQQRDATLAWRACAGDLAQGHRMISMEAAEAENESRKAMGIARFGDSYIRSKGSPAPSLIPPNLAA